MKPNAHAQQAELRAANEVTGPVFKMKTDPRVFPLRRILRKLSIDELPNLVTVLLGNMSIVLRVKPGITRVWQISGRSDVSFDRWLKLDHS